MPDRNCYLGPTIGFHRFDAALLMLACWRLELAPRGQASRHGAVARPPTWPWRAVPPSCIYHRPPVFFLCTLRSPPLPVFLFALLLLLIRVVACWPPLFHPHPLPPPPHPPFVLATPVTFFMLDRYGRPGPLCSFTLALWRLEASSWPAAALLLLDSIQSCAKTCC